MKLEDIGLIGNCQFSALIERSGSVVWCCLPRFDSEPVFGSLLDPSGGDFSIEPADRSMGQQRYIENTNILETVFETSDGRFRILDLAPRFSQHDRMFRPTQLVRIVEPLEGTPVIRVRCEPRLGWSKVKAGANSGSNHLQFEGFAASLRLTSDISPTHLSGQPFALVERRHLVLSWGAPVEEDLAPLCERFLSEIRRELSQGGWLFRYRNDDGLGQTTSAFMICTFWLIEAMAATGQFNDARELMKRIERAFSPLGLLSEDLDPVSGRMWGNFPQCYSHVGLIHAAFAASPRWSEVL